MARRNKGGSRAVRRAANDRISKEQRARFEADHEVMDAIIHHPMVKDADIRDAERWFYSLYRSVVVKLEELGEEPQRFTEHARIKPTKVVNDVDARYCPCRQCIFSGNVGKDAMGHYSECTALHDEYGNRIMCAHDDGCTRGIRRGEYRK